MTSAPRCVILGGGGHARVLIDALEASQSATPHGVVDADPALRGSRVLGVPVLGADDILPSLPAEGVHHFVVGVGSVGDSKPRERLFAYARSCGLAPATIIHPSAVVSPHAEIGAGAQLLANCVVNAGARIGENAIVNSAAVVEHDCLVGDHAHIATGARLASTVTVGSGAHVGAGATVRQHVRIGEHAIVGAGAVVVKDVEAGVTVVGVPAQPIRR